MSKNVTFEGADDGTVEVHLDERVFVLGEEVTNVSQENVDRLNALPGLSFKITDQPSAGKKEG